MQPNAIAKLVGYVDTLSGHRRRIHFGRIASEVALQPEATDAQVRDFYDKNPDKFKQDEAVRASHILIAVVENTDEATRSSPIVTIQPPTMPRPLATTVSSGTMTMPPPTPRTPLSSPARAPTSSSQPTP